LFLASAPDGRVWASGHDFMVHFDPGSSPLRSHLVPLPDNLKGTGWIFSFSSKGVLWLTGSFGLERFDGRRWRNFGIQDGLLAVPAMAVATGEDDVWIGYNEVPGITHFWLNSAGLPMARQFPLDVSIMGKDSHGRIWCGGIDGLVV